MNWKAGVLLGLLLGGGVWGFFRAEGSEPEIQAPDAVLVGTGGLELSLGFRDPGSGLRSIRVAAVQSDGETLLAQEEYPGNPLSGGIRKSHQLALALEPAQLREIQQAQTLRVEAVDWSLRGNTASRDLPLTVDLIPPRIEVATGLTYVTQGGSGAVAYRLDGPVARDGVRVGDDFFAGFPRPGGAAGERVALYAISAEAPKGATIEVTAEDPAGNRASASWPVRVKWRDLHEANVTLGKHFTDSVVPRFFGNGHPAPENPAEAFDEVNTRVRAENELRVREALRDRDAPPAFDGVLVQLRNSKVTSRFGERRTYFFEGRPVSTAIHYGYDLASTAAAPITASGAGRVVHADDLGIYGNCVLIDHGLGLATLYGHLSRLDVAPGDRVEQGQQLGLSGATGLAGGDHLHFAVLVGDVYVDPREWWDPKWVKTHVTDVVAR